MPTLAAAATFADEELINCVAIPIVNLSTTVYKMTNFGGLVVAPVGQHFRYTWGPSRVTTVLTPGANITTVTLALNPGGDTVYLPYGQNEIHSVLLPGVAAGVTCFTTAGMSGCRMYVDEIVGTNNIIVYHANHYVPGGGANPLTLNVEPVAVAGGLDALYNAARADYAALGHALHSAATIGRTTYNTPAVTAVLRKTGQRRTNVDFWGGTTIVGELAGGRWSLHWQTYGDTEYRRPFPKSVFKGRDRIGVGNMVFRNLDNGRFYG